MPSASFLNASILAKDRIVSFMIDDPRNPTPLAGSLTLKRTLRDEWLLPREERGACFFWEHDERRSLAEVRWREGAVEIVDRNGWLMDIDLRAIHPPQIERAMAVLERMNFDGAFRISGGTAPAAAQRDLLLELLADDDPDVVRPALEEAQKSRALLSDVLLEILENLTPEEAEESNLPAFAMYLLAAWRETRALDPLLRYLEHGGEEAVDALGDIIPQDLTGMLGSLVAGRFDRVRAVVLNEKMSDMVRWAAIGTLVSAAVRGDLPVEEVEAFLEEVILTRPPADESDLWTALAIATRDLASKRLLPHIEPAFEQGLVEEFLIRQPDLRRNVHGGRERAFRGFLKKHQSRLVEDAVHSTRWWDFWNKREAPSPVPSARPELPRPDGFPDDDFSDDDDWPAPSLYEPVPQVVRAAPKVGRNDPCPCGSAKKYKKCCGG
jgi:hypothetical protein